MRITEHHDCGAEWRHLLLRQHDRYYEFAETHPENPIKFFTGPELVTTICQDCGRDVSVIAERGIETAFIWGEILADPDTAIMQMML